MHNGPGRYYRSFADGQIPPGRRDDCAARQDSGIPFDDDFSRPAMMGDNCAAETNCGPFMNLDRFRILILEINIITDKHFAVYPYTAQSMQKGPQIG